MDTDKKMDIRAYLCDPWLISWEGWFAVGHLNLFHADQLDLKDQVCVGWNAIA